MQSALAITQPPIMRTYAGIGSRDITGQEAVRIRGWAAWLKKRGYILLSGNASGSDRNFQEGAGSAACLLLPWEGFGHDWLICCSEDKRPNWEFVCGDYPEGQASVDQYHPAPARLSSGVRNLMARSYYQVKGFGGLPQVDFVLCCANEDEQGNVLGGTGQACRIASSLSIPVFNMRRRGYRDEFLRWWRSRAS